MSVAVRSSAAVRCGAALLGTLPAVRAAAALALAGALLGGPPDPASALGHSQGPPHPHARAWIVMEASTGDVVAPHHADQRLRIASTTKLMTALIAMERKPLSATLRAVAYHANPAEVTLGLRRGERLTVRDLLRGILLPSANDTAATLARGLGRSNAAFVRTMNARAAQLGLRDTHYSNPVGLDGAGNYSSARDLVRLAAVLLKRPFFAHTVARTRATLTSGARRREVRNHNDLVGRYRWVRGVKTGHTSQAGYILVGLGRRHGVSVLSAVLGAPSVASRDAGTLSLLRYGLSRFRSDPVFHRGQVLAHAQVRYRSGQRVDLVAQRTASFVLPVGARATVKLVGVPRQLTGPLPAGTAAGAAVVSAGTREVARIPLVTARGLGRATLGQRLGDYLSRPLTLALLTGLVGCSLLLALLKRRATHRRRAADRAPPGRLE